MILSKLVQAQPFVAHTTHQARHFPSFRQKIAVYWFSSDLKSKNNKPFFKKQPIEKKPIQQTQPAQKPKSRLFKKLNEESTPTSSQLPNQLCFQKNPSTPLQKPNQTLQEWSRRVYLNNFHSCELLLNNFKDITKQSKDVPGIIKNFILYEKKLIEFSVTETQLKHKYKPILYASVMRAFSRILRREVFLERVHFIRFFGDQYEVLENLDISSISTLELCDFVEFFNLFEISKKFKTFSEGKLRVIDKFLKEIHTKYTEQQDQADLSNEEHSHTYAESQQHSIDQQKLVKRRLSELIMVSKTAQIFNSSFYEDFLELLLQKIHEQDLNSYKITTLLRFILRPESINEMQKQAIILDKILAKIQSIEIFKDFNFFNLKEFYVNLCSIVDNKEYIFDMTHAKQMIIKIEEYILISLHKLQSDDIYQVTFYSLRRQELVKRNLARELLTRTFNEIRPDGQTSLNPLFLVKMFSVICSEEISFSQIHPLLEEKFINMFNRYLLDTHPLPGLRYCSEYIENIYYKTQSQKIKQLIINSFLSPQKKLIIPYNNESYMLETHFLFSNDTCKKLASLQRLAKVRSRIQKVRGFLGDVFETLEAKSFSKEIKPKVIKQNKEYINSVQESRINRQGYMKILSRYCKELEDEELIDEIFYQSLIYMIEKRDQHSKNINSFQKIDFKNFTDFSQIDLPQILDQKCRDKVQALFHTFITILFEFDLDLTKIQSEVSIWQKINSNKFLKLIKNHDIIGQIFLELLCRRQIGALILWNKDVLKTQFLLKLLRYFCLKLDMKSQRQQNIQRNSSADNLNYEQYYSSYYQILKIYPVDSLKFILSTDEGKHAIDKVLVNKKETTKSSSHKMNENIQTKKCQFIYDKFTGDVQIHPEHVKVLKLKVEKSLNKKEAEKKEKLN